MKVYSFILPLLTLGMLGGTSGLLPESLFGIGERVDALPAQVWSSSEWISAADAPVYEGPVNAASRAVRGTSWFAATYVNEAKVMRARWMTTALGVYELYVNGQAIGKDFLKPGFTHVKKTRRAFTYDVTDAFRCEEGAANVLSAEVGAGWWRDKIVTPSNSGGGFAGRKSAFRAVLEVTYEDGRTVCFGTTAKGWRAGTLGPVLHSGIFDGEEYDARELPGHLRMSEMGEAERNEEFSGEILPSAGGEIVLRWDKAIVRGPFALKKGETIVVDFGQNCAGVPAFCFKATRGTKLTCLPAEMLNDAPKGVRGCDGPEGSVYRANLRMPDDGMRATYVFVGNEAGETYHPRFTFFGYRYIALSATDDVDIQQVVSVPVSSVTRDMEIGRIETGDVAVNQLISNVYWGQLSNYLSVPTDCPQRNERLGWTADTQVFVEAGSFNADTRAFFNKWMRDLVDSQDAKGGFPGVAPTAQYGNEMMRIGWADAGVIVPYQIWKQFGDRSIIDDNWTAMVKFVARVNETRYEHAAIKEECRDHQWADWLSFEKFESAGGSGNPDNCAYHTNERGERVRRPETTKYWDFLGGCYWAWDAELMSQMAEATGRHAEAAEYRKMALRAKSHLYGRFFGAADGMVDPLFRDMQTPALFALKLGLVTGEAKMKTIAALRASVAAKGCLQTGFLGTSILMDTLTENGMSDVAYDLLFSRKCPGWLYSVEQGATTIWERWNSYTKVKGFGPVGMNSFNHYAYGAVLAWLYKTGAGIAADPRAPGFARIVMAPKPDERLGHLTAEYRSAAGLVKSAWKFEGDSWVWDFTIPEGTTALVTVPGETSAKLFSAGTYHITKRKILMQIEELNARYGAPGRLVFHEGFAGYPNLVLSCKYGSAEVSLLGANVLAYRPTGHSPVIFRPSRHDNEYNRGDLFHGGIPVCWPQFGRLSDPTLPPHGFASKMVFEVRGTEYSEEMAEVTLGLKSTPETKEIWNNDFDFEVKISVSMKLNLMMTTRNTGKAPFSFSCGFHPYLRVRDRNATRVAGLHDCAYIDAREKDWVYGRLEGDLDMNFAPDHVFTLPEALKHEVALIDPGLKRAIAVVSTGNTREVVWNCGDTVMSDHEPGDWQKYVCVEPVSDWPKGRTLEPGAEYSLGLAIQSTLEQ